MKLSIRNHFDCDAEALWEVFQDPEFEKRMEANGAVSREIIEDKKEGDVEYRVLRCVSKRELPRVLAKAIGSKHLAYDQTARLDRAKNTLEWEVIPTLMSDKVTAKGTTRVIPGASGCDRIVEGDISVRVRLIGGQIEKVLMSNIEEGMKSAVELAKVMLKERGA